MSWGRTLKLATAASADICGWLQATEVRRNKFDGLTQTRQYNLLLVRSAGLSQLQQSTQMKVRDYSDFFVELRDVDDLEDASGSKHVVVNP